jgi:hypothetical protein
MDARTVDASGEGPPEDAQRPAPSRVARRSKAGKWLRGGGSDTHDGLVEELEAELALLREENARLKIRGARERARPWGGEAKPRDSAQPPADEAGDAWELITECELLRTALGDACRDLDAAMERTRGRLDAHAAARGRAAT